MANFRCGGLRRKKAFARQIQDCYGGVRPVRAHASRENRDRCLVRVSGSAESVRGLSAPIRAGTPRSRQSLLRSGLLNISKLSKTDQTRGEIKDTLILLKRTARDSLTQLRRNDPWCVAPSPLLVGNQMSAVPVSAIRNREKIILTRIRHADFGAPACGGHLYGRSLRETAGIICDECLQIIQMVSPAELKHVLAEMSR
jgi:hypothetical protein